MRNQVWNNFCNEKYKAYYLNELNSILRYLDLAINFITALATTASVAAWAFWKVFPWLWVGIVGVSQLITVAKPFFPFLRDLRRMTECELMHEHYAFEFEKLYMKYEKAKWRNSDNEILKLREALAKDEKRFLDLNVPHFRWLKNAAYNERNLYLKINHGIIV